MKLQRKILLYVFVILILSIGSITALSFFQMKTLISGQYSKDMLDVSRAVSESSIVKQYLQGDQSITNDMLNREVNNIKLRTQVNFIVVMNMKGIRQTHPVWQEIGRNFEGGDEKRVLEKGEEYTSEARGTLGTSFRAFTPVYGANGQVGAVCVGVFKGNFSEAISSNIWAFIPFIMLGLMIGAIGAVMLSYNIKKILFGLEPEEIAMILKRKESVLENIKEGIVSLDKEGRIILFNREAASIIGLEDSDLGRPITDFVDGSRVPEVLESGEALENVEVKVRPGLSIMSKINPLKNDKQQVIGVLINFRNLTEIQALAEELTGVKKMAWSLRAQNHEFMNKLHTIAGLIQLEEYDEALQFISAVAKSRDKISSILTRSIKDPAVLAILLSKYNKAEECHVKFRIDETSDLTRLPEYMTSEEIVSIVGNLVENSLEAVPSDGRGRITVRIAEDAQMLLIQVKDNGPGIPEALRDSIFEQGFTTKEGQRGDGLYNVKKIIEDAKGWIGFTVNDGVIWDIGIPMTRGGNDDRGNDH